MMNRILGRAGASARAGGSPPSTAAPSTAQSRPQEPTTPSILMVNSLPPPAPLRQGQTLRPGRSTGCKRPDATAGRRKREPEMNSWRGSALNWRSTANVILWRHGHLVEDRAAERTGDRPLRLRVGGNDGADRRKSPAEVGRG